MRMMIDMPEEEFWNKIREIIREELGNKKLKNSEILNPKSNLAMTAIQPDIPDTGRYTPKQAAEFLGISRSTLNKYAISGLIKFGIRKTNGRKFFTGF